MRFMRWMAWGVVMVSWLGVVRAGVVEIKDIKTVEDLKKAEAIVVPGDAAAGGGWEVRLGLGDSGEEGGPWVVLYCWAKYVGEGEPKFAGNWGAEPLGPVGVKVTWNEVRDLVEMEKDMFGRIDRESLHAMTIPVAWKGTCHVQVVTPDGKTVLAKRDMEIKEPRKWYWQELGVVKNVRAGERKDGGAAYPSAGGHLNLLRDDRGVLPAPADMEMARWPQVADMKALSLPWALPVSRDWLRSYGGAEKKVAEGEVDRALVLSIDKGEFVIQSEGGLKMIDWPEKQLLARWWVNGVGVEAEASDQHLEEAARLVRFVQELRVGVGLPAALKAVKAGDKVGVQMMYTPGGHRPITSTWAQGELHKAQLGGHEQAPVALVSNRVDFVVTEDMLKTRAAPP